MWLFVSFCLLTCVRGQVAEDSHYGADVDQQVDQHLRRNLKKLDPNPNKTKLPVGVSSEIISTMESDEATLNAEEVPSTVDPVQTIEDKDKEKQDKEKKKDTDDRKLAVPNNFVYVQSSTSTRTTTITKVYKCDGYDDHVQIQQALSYINSLSGGTVRLSDGIFTIDRNVNITSNTVLTGAGIDVTVIKLKNKPTPWKVGTKSASGMIRGYQVNNIEISELSIDGNKYNLRTTDNDLYGRYGFYCEVCVSMVLRNIRSHNNYGYGIDPHGKPNVAVYSDGLSITGCTVDNNGWDGITIDKTKNTRIENNNINNNGRHGINICTGSIGTTITNNRIADNGFYYYKGTSGNGVMVQNNDNFGTAQTTITSNTITNSKAAGIYLNDVDRNMAKANMINGPGNCMSIRNTDSTTVDSNVCNSPKKVVLYEVNTNLVAINQPNVAQV